MAPLAQYQILNAVSVKQTDFSLYGYGISHRHGPAWREKCGLEVLAGFAPSLYNMNYRMAFFGARFAAVCKARDKKGRPIIAAILCNLDLR